jgi:N-acyl-phosphatidylethanolamine-hydrolysing phospholipase D
MFLTPERLTDIPDQGWQVTWLGHASFLLSGCGGHLLIDPIFSDVCGPQPWLGFKRHAPPPCGITDLPPITAVLLTHTHYDHCDLPTLRRLGRELPLVVPAGHRHWFLRKGFAQVTEIAWWEGTRIASDIVVTATPARHFTARTPWDRNCGHWCGFHLSGNGTSLWHSGDSGYGPAFHEIGCRLGPVDFGMIAIGAYEPRWFMHPLHMNPAEAVQAFQETRCRRAVGMHWGTFRLSDEPLGEPPLLLAAALREQNLPPVCFTTAPIGSQWQVLPGAQ